MKKLLAILVATLLVFSACAVAEGWTEHTLKDQFEYLVPEGEAANLDDYYNDLGIDCECEYRATGGSVKWLGGADVPLPTPTKEYTIGFSVYYTVDEVGAMYLTGMKDAAKEIGVNLLVNDANYDQELQNQAIEGWILEDVDAVILTPCDFYGCQQALDALEEAGIPVVTLDCPPCAGSIDSAIVYDAVEQGRQAGEMLLDVPSIIYQTNTKVTADNVEEMFEVYYNGATLADYMAGN